MRLIHVVSIVDGNVCSLNTFNDSNTEDAHDMFKRFAREQINENLTDDELDDYIMDGTIESDSSNLAINLVWSTIEDC